MGQTEITGCCNCLMRKNGEQDVIDFACAKGRRVDIYAGSRQHSCNLTNMHQKASACIGLRVAMVPESYQRSEELWLGLSIEIILKLYSIKPLNAKPLLYVSMVMLRLSTSLLMGDPDLNS
jgi:hypothetical protein